MDPATCEVTGNELAKQGNLGGSACGSTSSSLGGRGARAPGELVHQGARKCQVFGLHALCFVPEPQGNAEQDDVEAPSQEVPHGCGLRNTSHSVEKLATTQGGGEHCLQHHFCSAKAEFCGGNPRRRKADEISMYANEVAGHFSHPGIVLKDQVADLVKVAGGCQNLTDRRGRVRISESGLSSPGTNPRLGGQVHALVPDTMFVRRDPKQPPPSTQRTVTQRASSSSMKSLCSAEHTWRMRKVAQCERLNLSFPFLKKRANFPVLELPGLK